MEQVILNRKEERAQNGGVTGYFANELFRQRPVRQRIIADQCFKSIKISCTRLQCLTDLSLTITIPQSQKNKNLSFFKREHRVNTLAN